MIRIFDIFFSFIAFTVFFPIFVIVSVFLRMTGEGEIIFLQKRIGLGGQEFRIIKFATMLKNSSNMGTGNITVKNDPRILPFGKFLRSSKINELPQLINILKGEMSIIGPRPLTKDQFDKYPMNIQEELKKIRPGLSGIGSIIFRNEEEILELEQNLKMHEDILSYKATLESWYYRNRSIYLYFLTIFLTLLVVIFPSVKPINILPKSLPKAPEDIKDLLP